MYGQDVEFEKSVTLAIGDCNIVIPHLDAMLGSQKHVHNLSDGRVLVTFVVREGKTTVSKFEVFVASLRKLTNSMAGSAFGEQCERLQSFVNSF